MYKGHRIAELLANIADLQSVLEHTKHTAEGDDVFRCIESEATLAIMKAKLTALQGEN
jgi:hypothetical protein